MKTTPKQILALLLVLVLLLSLCACVQKTQTEPNESRTSTDKVKMPTKPDKKTPEKQPEEAPLQTICVIVRHATRRQTHNRCNTGFTGGRNLAWMAAG